MPSAVLAEAIGTEVLTEDNPVALFMDVERIRAKARSMQEAFADVPGIVHAFAVKANPLVGVLKTVRELGGGAECASIVEVEHSIRCGFPASKVIFDSPCKTRTELARCFELGVLCNLDCMEEIEKVGRIIEELAERDPTLPGRVRVGVRINPQCGGGAGDKAATMGTSTATKDSKFGVGISDYHEELLAAFLKYEWLTGLHCHVGSQGCAVQLLVEGVKCIVRFAEEVNAAAGFKKVRMLDIGGGLPMNYESDEENPTYRGYSDILREECPQVFSGEYEVYTEFGRSLVQKAGWIGSRVEFTKRAGGKNIATVHCGSNMMLRTCYLPDKWKHDVTVLDHTGMVKGGERAVYDIAGPLCFGGDMVALNRLLPRMVAGDHMVIHDCGGYTMAMYSRYNSRPCPPVYAYDTASATPSKLMVWKEPETIDQVLTFWAMPEA